MVKAVYTQEERTLINTKRNGWEAAEWAMLALLMLAFLLRVVALDAQGLWADEMATVVISERDWAGVIKWVIDDRVHPPLYYLLTSPWMALGRGEAWLRYPSAMWGVLATALGYALGKRLHGRRVGVTGAALLVLSPLLLWHSRDARMYAMLTALTIGSSYFFVRLWDGARRRDWVGYVIFSLMAVYTHHFAVWIMLAQFVFIALARRHYPQALKAWTLGAGLVGMLYAPWILTILSGEGLRRAGISWVPAAGLLDPLWTLFTFLLGHSADPFNPVFYLAFLPALGLLAFAVIRFFGEREASLGYLLAWLFVPLAMVWIISLDWPLPEKRAIYMDRFMIGQMPAFLLLIAWGLERLARWRRWAWAMGLALILVPTLFSVHGLYCDVRYWKEDWRGVITYIDEHSQGRDLLLITPAQYHILYYYRPDVPWDEVPLFLGDDEKEAEVYLADEMPRKMAEIAARADRMWYVVPTPVVNAHLFVYDREAKARERVAADAVKGWLDKHYSLSEERQFPGVYLVCYRLKE